MNTTWTEIALALIQSNDRILVGLRKNPRVWELPGGKIELQPQKETPEQTIKRELQEELGISSTVGRIRGVCSTHVHIKESKSKKLRFYLFDIHKWEGSIVNKVHHEIRWIHPKELSTLPTHPINQMILPELLSFL